MRVFSLLVVFGIAVADCSAASAVGHPRLFADKARLAELRTFCGRNPTGKAYRKRLLEDAERLVDAKPVERVLTGRRLLDVSREALARISCLAFAAQLTGERTYAQRGVTELKTICEFSDWHTEHYLDTGELALAAAIGYDWLFAEMDAETRRRCARAIAARSLETWNEKLWWAKSDSNWNAVCNAGTLAACWALWDDPAEGALARKVFAAARKSVANGFKCYAPEGAYPEGPMYWDYGTAFACIAAEVVHEATGSDELFASRGFDRTCEYPGRMTGPSGNFFDFGDGHLHGRPSFPSFYLAWKFKRPETLSAFKHDLVSAQGRDRLFPLTGLYLDLDIPPADRRTVPEFWSSSESGVPCCSAKLPNGAWFAVRGGKAASPHMHMDVGGFVYEAKNRRFVIDYGMEPYHNAEKRGIQIWDNKRGGGRWNCFRLGPEAHAILRINGEMQDSDGFAPFTAFETNALPYKVTLDLSALYPKARRVTRTFTLKADGRLVIRDLAEGLAAGDRVSAQYPLAKGSYRVAASASSAADVLTLVCAGAESTVSDQQTRLAGWEHPIQPSDRVDFTKRAGKDGRVELVTELIPPR